MHAIPRLAVAVGLLGTTLTACQLSPRDQKLVTSLRREVSRLTSPAHTATPAPAPATPTSQPADATLATPAATPVAPLPELTPDLASPDGVAAALGSAEAAVHSGSTPAATLQQAAHQQQRAYDAVAAHPDWRDAVVARVPAPLHDAVAANADAAVQLRQLNRSSDELPHWRVTAPPPAADLLRWYREAEAESGVPWAYFAAINLVETRMGRVHADSVAGAQGPMQFMPDTWQQYGDGGDVHDPHAAILAAGRFLKAAGGPGDMPGALRQYNPSDLYVAAVSAYAQRMLADPQAFAAYYQWQAEASTTSQGDVILPAGYDR